MPPMQYTCFRQQIICSYAGQASLPERLCLLEVQGVVRHFISHSPYRHGITRSPSRQTATRHAVCRVSRVVVMASRLTSGQWNYGQTLIYVPPVYLDAQCLVKLIDWEEGSVFERLLTAITEERILRARRCAILTSLSAFPRHVIQNHSI